MFIAEGVLLEVQKNEIDIVNILRGDDNELVERVLDALLVNTSVTKLSFFQIEVDEHLLQLLVQTLAANKHITYLEFGSCWASKSKFAAKTSKETNKTLKSVHVYDWNGKSAHMDLLIETLAKNTALKSLHVDITCIDDECMLSIANMVADSSSVLDLSLTGDMSSDGLLHLVEAMKVNKTVTVLDLSSYAAEEYTAVKTCMIAEMIAFNDTLQILDLGGLEITEQGLQSLYNAMEVNNTLRKLHLMELPSFDDVLLPLRDNSFEDKLRARKQIAEAIQKRCKENAAYADSDQFRIDRERHTNEIKQAKASAEAKAKAEIDAIFKANAEAREAEKNHALVFDGRAAPLLGDLMAARRIRAQFLSSSIPHTVIELLQSINVGGDRLPRFADAKQVADVLQRVRDVEATVAAVRAAATKVEAIEAARARDAAFLKCLEAATVFVAWKREVGAELAQATATVATVRDALCEKKLALPVVLPVADDEHTVQRADVEDLLTRIDNWAADGKPERADAAAKTEANAKELMSALQSQWSSVFDVLGAVDRVEMKSDSAEKKRAGDVSPSKKRRKLESGAVKEENGGVDERERAVGMQHGLVANATLERAMETLKASLQGEAAVIAQQSQMPQPLIDAVKALAARLLSHVTVYSQRHLRTFHDAAEVCAARLHEFETRARGAPSTKALKDARRAEKKARTNFLVLQAHHQNEDSSGDDDNDDNGDGDNAAQVVDEQLLQRALATWREAATAYNREAMALANAVHLYPELAFDERVAELAGDNGSLTIGRSTSLYDNWQKLASSARHDVVVASYNGKRCAIKSFHLGSDADLRAFTKEVAILKRLSHPHVVDLCAAFTEKDQNKVMMGYVQMPFYEYGDLWSWKATVEPVDALVASVLRGALLGLAHVHAHGIVHADVKPANVLVDANHNAKLGDFDVSKDSSTRARLLTTTAMSVVTTVGFTPSYVSPELLSPTAVATAASDVYAFGLTIFDVCFAPNAQKAPPRPPVLEVACGRSQVEVPELCENVPLREALAALLVVNPAKRVSAVDALSTLAFFSSMVDDDEGVRECNVCYDKAVVSGGVVCASDHAHFVCASCLLAYVKSATKEADGTSSLLAIGGGVRCPIKVADAAHDDCVYDDARLARVLPVDAFTTVMNVRKRATEQRLVAEFEVQFEQRRRVDEKRGLVERHRLHISDRLLTLACPRCAQAFIDFEGCFALKCARCQAGFCAWCLTDCGADAHQHAANCEYGNGNVIGHFDEFDGAQRKRRTRMVREYLERLPEELREEVREACAKEFGDLGVRL